MHRLTLEKTCSSAQAHCTVQLDEVGHPVFRVHRKNFRYLNFRDVFNYLEQWKFFDCKKINRRDFLQKQKQKKNPVPLYYSFCSLSFV